MDGTFLKAAAAAGILDHSRASAYTGFLTALRQLEGVSVSIHGLELADLLSPAEAATAAPDFACFLESNLAQPTQPWLNCMRQLSQCLGCSGVWVEFDAHQWEPPIPQPRGLPLLYFSPEQYLSPALFAETKLMPLLEIMTGWLVDQSWSGERIPESSSIKRWLMSLPGEGQIQQFGLAFRQGIVQPRVLLHLPRRGATLELLRVLNAPKALLNPHLEGQMLVAAAFPYAANELMGLELLADRCSLQQLRQMRQQPLLRGSRLERVLRDLGFCNEQRLKQWTAVEGRDSKRNDHGIEVSLRGVNHLKAVLRQGRLVDLKVYLGEVNNSFTRREPGGTSASPTDSPTAGPN